jgi:hypothetical protein
MPVRFLDPPGFEKDTSIRLTSRERREFLICFVLLLLVIGFGLYGWVDHVLAEMKRIPPLLAITTWVFEATGLLAALWLLGAYIIMDVPIPSRGDFWPKSVAPIVLAFLVDCAVTSYVQYEEHQAYQRSQEATAEIVRIGRGQTRTGGLRFLIRYRYLDAAGEAHLADAWLSSAPDVAMFANLPESLQPSLEQMQVPTPLAIRVDPQRPQRSWIDGVGWNRGDGFSSMFVPGLALQAFLLLTATLAVGFAGAESARLAYRFAPMGIMALWFAAMGVIRLAQASSVDQWVP